MRKRNQLIILAMVTVLLSMSVYPAMSFDRITEEGKEQKECSYCHTCDAPTSKEPCLSHDFCNRNSQLHSLDVIPETSILVLDVLENVYESVEFNHEKHASMSDMSGGCTNCHHYAPPTNKYPDCSECHLPEGLVGKIEPGLKAAYHKQCMGCHNEWDNDTHCEFCHRKKEGGMSEEQLSQMPYIAHEAPLQVKDLIIMDKNHDDDGNQIPFHHRNHVELYDRNCSTCHQNETCSNCHIHNAGEVHTLNIQTVDEKHDICFKCHSSEESDCKLCHGRDPADLFDHASTGWPIKSFHSKLQCKDCHHDSGKYQANDPRCITCHFGGFPETFDHSTTGVVFNEDHEDNDCIDCHINGLGTVATCEECHDDNRKWDPKKGFEE